MITTRQIKVYNYDYSPVCLSGLNRQYVIDAATDNDHPAFTLIPFSDVEIINSATSVFRNGIVEFEVSEAKALHEELGNYNWKDTVLTRKQINDIILHPTYEKMKRIVAVTDVQMIERFRSELIRVNTLAIDGVSRYVEYIINERFAEITVGKRNSAIILREEKFENSKKIEAIVSENVELKEKLNAIEEKVEAIVSAKTSSETPTESKTVAKKATAKKSPGRPPKAKAE